MKPPAGLITSVEPESPADDAGFYPGCKITHIDGHAVRDVIDYRWYSDGAAIEVAYIDGTGDAGCVRLERDEGQDWGFGFENLLFDGTRLCRNACTFCFMRQLPSGMRPSLSLRDDDYRLSFLQGNFVTLTNLSPEDEDRIVAQHLSPLRFSLHAADASVRERMIGRHAQHGMDALMRLMNRGIDFHAQIVLVPGQNDAAVLDRTLEWAFEQAHLLTVGIVPLGFTRFQNSFSKSFDAPEDARAVIEQVAPWRERALARRGNCWVYPSDEFYRNAYGMHVLDAIPSARSYGAFDMFEDGIGMIRQFVDDWHACRDIADRASECLRQSGERVLFVCGTAQREFLGPLVHQSGLQGLFEPLYVTNQFFGGNVNVTGLLCAQDIIAALKAARARGAGDSRGLVAAIPSVVFNADGITLDGLTAGDIEEAAGLSVLVVSCQASEFLVQIIEAIAQSRV